jgi:hypothetical protein
MKILQMTTYNVDEMDHGGKLRCHHLRRVLRQHFNVQTLSFGWGNCVDVSTMSVILDQEQWEAFGIDGPLSDWGICTYLEKDNGCYQKLCILMQKYEPDVILLEQPFLWPLLKRFIQDSAFHSNIKVIYSSHNIEIGMKKKIYEDLYAPEVADRYSEYVDRMEKAAVYSCSAAIAVSSADAAYVKALVPSKPVRVFLNGHSQPSPTPEDHKWQARFADQASNWVYVASWHPPNINGLRDLVMALAAHSDSMNGNVLWILGGVGHGLEATTPGFKLKDYPWLRILGPVSTDDIESAILASTGLVLPIWEGGGSNLKTAQALLSNKCVIGSEFSFRGFEQCTNEPGVFLAQRAEDLAKLLISVTPQSLYTRGDNVQALTWERILEPLPGFIYETMLPDDVNDKL